MRDQYNVPQKLENPIQHYSWGSRTLIPELLGIPNPQESPFAELWMGVHPRGPSKLVTPSDGSVELSELISTRGVAMLGPDAATRFDGGLPFLFKVLAAEQALSIQAHPNREQAERGFRAEEARGIPVDAFERNYRDRNHKPEILCALTPFTAMCGFREPGEIHRLYHEIGSTVYRDSLCPGKPPAETDRQDSWLRDFFGKLLRLGQNERARLDGEVHEWAGTGKGSIPEADLILKFHTFHPKDPGVQAPLFLNVVELEPGEALYQPAGVLHAYVEGMGIELMANSDNVLRGGLTGKHVDVPELLRVLSFRPRPADVLEGFPLSGGGRRYDVPIDEFLLYSFSPSEEDGAVRSARTSLDIGICTEGELFIRKNKGSLENLLHIVKGESFVVPYVFGEYFISGRGTVFIATVPEAGGGSRE